VLRLREEGADVHIAGPKAPFKTGLLSNETKRNRASSYRAETQEVLLMKQALTVLFSCMLLFSIAGCGTQDTAGKQTATSQNEEIPGLFHKAELDGLEILVKASKIKYKPGEEMLVQAHIRNTTDKPLHYQTRDSCDPGISIVVPTKDGHHFALKAKGSDQQFACAEVLGIHELKPGETKLVTVTLLAKDHEKQQNVPPGEYEIRVGIRLVSKNASGMIDAEPPKLVETTAKFTVVE
jgi:hypothetical protein